MRCNVCEHPLDQPLYSSPGPSALTSLGERLERRHTVFLCERCSHLQTPALEDAARFYDVGYKILAQSQELDQVYEIGPGDLVYRSQHQAVTLQRQLTLAPGAAVLEYGAGKAATLRHLAGARPDLELYAFDVSRDYVRYWDTFLPAERQATYELPAAWDGKFDAVCAFFVLEHLESPRRELRTLRRLLKPSGVLYAVVPDVLANYGDFLVAEHVNHFNARSLRELARREQFGSITIDAKSHQAALILMSRPNGGVDAGPSIPGEMVERAKALADFWRAYLQRLRAFEAAHGRQGPSAIYGAGFYGAYLLSCLWFPEQVACFVDRNTLLQGGSWHDRPVVAPEALAEDVRTVYAGVNPLRAKAILAGVPSWERRRYELFLP